MVEQAGEDAPFPLTDVDKWVLSQSDEEFKYHDWDELREILREPAYCHISHGLFVLTISARCKQSLGPEA